MKKKLLALAGVIAATTLTGCVPQPPKPEQEAPKQVQDTPKTETKETPKTEGKVKETNSFTFQTSNPDAWKKYTRGGVDAWQRKNDKGSYLNISVVSVHDIVKSGAGWDGITDVALKQTLSEQGAIDIQIARTEENGSKNIVTNYLLSGGIECTQTYVQLKDNKTAIVAFTHPSAAKHEIGADSLENDAETVVKTVELK